VVVVVGGRQATRGAGWTGHPPQRAGRLPEKQPHHSYPLTPHPRHPVTPLLGHANIRPKDNGAQPNEDGRRIAPVRRCSRGTRCPGLHRKQAADQCAVAACRTRRRVARWPRTEPPRQHSCRTCTQATRRGAKRGKAGRCADRGGTVTTERNVILRRAPSGKLHKPPVPSSLCGAAAGETRAHASCCTMHACLGGAPTRQPTASSPPAGRRHPTPTFFDVCGVSVPRGWGPTLGLLPLHTRSRGTLCCTPEGAGLEMHVMCWATAPGSQGAGLWVVRCVRMQCENAAEQHGSVEVRAVRCVPL
jgi:hypothetical protein